MSKRSRDGHVLVQTRPNKRPGDFTGPDVYKRARCVTSSSSSLSSSSSSSSSSSNKRTADFDVEVERLHKRMKATTPTAEEAMAFLLPHLLSLKRMYCKSQQRVEALLADNQLLSSHNLALSRAYQALLSKSALEKNQLQRRLDQTQYHLALALPRDSF